MNEEPFIDVVKQICDRDPRFDPDAYTFIREALDFTVEMLEKPRSGPAEDRHVSGGELLEGIQTFAIQEFGPITMTVLKTWGISKTEDFGDIIFNLVAAGKLGSTDQDKKEDFANGYDFQEVFEKPFLPRNSGTEQQEGKNRP